MKQIYLDIMEKSLSAYTYDQIRGYISEVNQNGITEHGFPRLTVNMGILIVYKRRTELLDTFIEMMNICCEQIPKIIIGKPHRCIGNDFSIREICCCLMLLEKHKVIDEDIINKWKNRIKTFIPETGYDVVVTDNGFYPNWALFAAVSEYMRGVCCDIDTSEFVDRQLPSQIANLDCNDMYQDDPPYHNHTVYDIVPRFLIAFLLRAGYKGKYAERLKQVLDNTADITLKMQSVNGELAFGGRSNQFINNEPLLSSYCEMEAARFAEKGDFVRASEFKAAALLSANATLKHLNLNPISHIKNRYDVSSKIGCEDYGYFNKYMITVASNAYPGYLFANDSIAPSKAPAVCGGYVIRTSENFHKTFLNAGGYFLEFDTNADFHYDANGLGRIHKIGCPAPVCLSVPFSPNPKYISEGENSTAMSVCCYAKSDGEKLLGAETYAKYTLIEMDSNENRADVSFSINLADKITLTQTHTVSANGVDINVSGAENIGFMVPVFDFDGKDNTNITVAENSIEVEYDGSFCKYSFIGKTSSSFEYYYNRNGRYRVYSVNSKKLHIEIGTIADREILV